MLSHGTVSRGHFFISLLGKEQTTSRKGQLIPWAGGKGPWFSSVSAFMAIHSLVPVSFHMINEYPVPTLCQHCTRSSGDKNKKKKRLSSLFKENPHIVKEADN